MGRGAQSQQGATGAVLRTAAKPKRRTPGRDELIAAMLRLDLNAYEVGGCLRDELMGLAPEDVKDIDVVTVGITYDELLAKLKPEGKALELATQNASGKQQIGVRITAPWTPPEGVEIALARTERSLGLGTKNFEIVPDPSIPIEEDLKRRDFTCNALARSMRTGKLIDPFNGADDIRAGVLRAVTEHTCRDDAVRILRGLARVSHDNSDPTPETLEQMREWARAIAVESGDRRRMELLKILKGRHAGKALRMGVDIGAIQAALPWFAPTVGFDQRNKHHDLLLHEHQILATERAAEFREAVAEGRLKTSRPINWQAVSLAAFNHDNGKADERGHFEMEDGSLRFCRNPDDERSLNHEEASALIFDEIADEQTGLNIPVDLARQTRLLIAEHMFRDDEGFGQRTARRDRIAARQMIARVGRENIEELLMLRRCDRAAKSNQPLPDDFFEETPFEALVRAEMSCPVIRKELALKGGEIMAMGAQGTQIGEIQGQLLDWVRAQDDWRTANDAEVLRSRVARILAPVSPRDLKIKGADLMAMGVQGPRIGEIHWQLAEWVADQPDRDAANTPEALRAKAVELIGAQAPVAS